MQLCCFTVATIDYLDRAIVLINSFSHNSGLLYIFMLYLINVPLDIATEKTRSLPNTSVQHIDVDLKDEQLRCYSSCVRAVCCSRLLAQYKYIFYFDADTIIRKDLSELYNIMICNDISLNYLYEIVGERKVKCKNRNKNICNNDNVDKLDGGKKRKHKYKTGVMTFNSNPSSISYVNEWTKKLFGCEANLNATDINHGLTINQNKWYDDQNFFKKTVQEFADKIKVGNLAREYIDWKHLDSGKIWVGKGERKNKSMFLRESAKYL